MVSSPRAKQRTAIHISPITNKDRIQVIDILRGIALIGIIMVNVHEISYSWYVTEIAGNAIDRLAQFITDTFFLNKFYTLFSFLFGLGMAIQMIRAERKGVPFVRLYLQRLFWLLIFGLVHAIFIWDGDILATYALIGIFLLLLRKLNPVELNSLRFGGMGLANLGYYTLGVNAYECFINDVEPNWDELWHNKTDNSYAFFIAYNGANINIETHRPDWASFRNCFTKIIHEVPFDYQRQLAFGILYIEESKAQLMKLLDTEFDEFFIRDTV